MLKLSCRVTCLAPSRSFKMNASMRKKALERREAIAKRRDKLTHAQRQERYQQLKNERLQREREEYDSLTPEQKRRRDLKDEKRAKKAANSRKPKASHLDAEATPPPPPCLGR